MMTDESKPAAEESPDSPPGDEPMPIATELPPEESSQEQPDAESSPVESPEATEGETIVESAPATPAAPAAPTKNWYIVKVQSGREESIRNALERRIKIDSLEEHVGRLLIPTEKVVEMVRGKRVTKKRKKFPGYIMVEVEFNDKILFLFRETAGVGDFVGGSLTRPPQPMTPREVERMLADEDDGTDSKKAGGSESKEPPKIVVKVQKGDRVKVQSGTFAGMVGEVKEVIYGADPKETPRVKVEVVIWGRPVSMDIEYFYVDLVE